MSASAKTPDPVDASLGCLVLLLSLPVGVLTWGYLTVTIWAWFIAPVFALPLLTFWQAVGLRLMVNTLTFSSKPTEDKSAADHLRHAVNVSLLTPAMALFFAWIIRGLSA